LDLAEGERLKRAAAQLAVGDLEIGYDLYFFAGIPAFSRAWLGTLLLSMEAAACTDAALV